MKKTLSAIFLTFVISFTAQAQEKVNFKLNLKKGENIKYELFSKTDVSGAQDVMMDMIMSVTLTPTNITDTSIYMDAKYSHIKMDLNSGPMMMSYDSSTESQDEIAKALEAQLAPLLTYTTKMEVKRDGKVINIETPENLGQAFDKGTLESLTLNFPSNEISIGDSWNISKSMADLGIDSEMTYTLTEKTAEGYKVEVKGLFLNQDDKEVGKLTGHYIIDPTTCLTISSSSDSNFEVQGQKFYVTAEIKQVK